ncbi:MAG: MFS transporter [Bacteroidales bacterium]|nr:MFS transporter [Bacteroidales bacterium]
MDRPTPYLTAHSKILPHLFGLLATLKHTTFRSLQHRDYRLYFAGQIVSFTGTWMQNAALMWLVFDLTNNPIWPPLLLVAQVGPTLLFGTFGGALADRIPKRRLIMATQVLFLTNAILLTTLVALGWASPWALLLLQFSNGLVQAIDLPARLAFVSDLVPRYDLINAISLNSLLFNSARAIGPAFAGIVFVSVEWLARDGEAAVPVSWGASACFGLNSLSFAAVLWALGQIQTNGMGSERDGEGSTWEGVRYVLARPVLGAVLLLTGALSVFGWPVMSLFPAYTRMVLGLGVEHYSTLVSSLGAGALAGALLTATFGTIARRGWFFLAGSSLTTLGMIGLALAESLTVAAGAAGLLGAGLILFLSTGQSVLQLSSHDQARGRVMALWAMTLSASAPFGHLLAGAAATHFGVIPVVMSMTVGAAMVVVCVFLFTVLHGWTVEDTPVTQLQNGPSQ